MRTSANVSAVDPAVTVMVEPVAAAAGAVSMTGRCLAVPSALKRYGGGKIFPPGLVVVAPIPPNPPPPAHTPPPPRPTRPPPLSPPLTLACPPPHFAHPPPPP